ncbi:hypothetical protein ISU02_16110 [Fusibacter sp. Q10-2]|uniref:Uncharacterized protein n=1 Tax=Fusibacter ferrireducens TaxID=2785058 RepID=A0ABR9ZW08_9FIRM|nr:hypothetical protein [Fusibacter ferrireducens]
MIKNRFSDPMTDALNLFFLKNKFLLDNEFNSKIKTEKGFEPKKVVQGFNREIISENWVEGS